MPFSYEIALEGCLNGGGKHMQILDEQFIMLGLSRFKEQFSKLPVRRSGLWSFLCGVKALEDE